jgi:hypothetical protein
MSSDQFSMGTVELKSGRWQWMIQDERSGYRIHFRHQTRIDDEMQSWVAAKDLTPEGVREAGADPLYRVWRDRDGVSWRLTLEMPSGEAGAKGLRLVFSVAGLRKGVAVAPTTALGELTHRELSDLFEATRRD